MTSTLERRDYTALTDEQLADAFCEDGADNDGLNAEADRREALRRTQHAQHAARHARWRREGDWYDMAYAQYVQAERECAGVLVNHHGLRRTDQLGLPMPVEPFTLWSGSQWETDAYASEELQEFWETHPRLTRAAWKRQQEMDRRLETDDAMDRDERGGVRQDSGSGPEDTRVYPDGGGNDVPAPDAGDDAEADRGAARADAGRGAAVRSVILTEDNPVTVIPGPGSPELDRVAAARARLQQIADRAAARAAVSHPEPDSMSAPVAVAERPGALSVRTPGTVAETASRREIDGAETLNYARMFLARFAIWPSEAALDAVTLWIAHAHSRDVGGVLTWQCSPRLLFSSAEPGSGKSHGMQLTARLCPVPEVLVEPSEPAVAHLVGKEHATLFLDEADELFGRGSRKEAIRAVINSGYVAGSSWTRVRKGEVDKVPTFGALAMAGLDKIETATGGQMAALLSRCIRIRMTRGPEGYLPPRYDAQARSAATIISKRLAAWAAQSLTALGDEVPEVPEGIGNRQAQIWEPLLVAADAAGGRWPDAARVACEELTVAGALADEDEDEVSDLDAILTAWGEAS